MNTNEIVDAILTALDSLDWVQWVKDRMAAASSPAANATAPSADALAPRPVEQYAAHSGLRSGSMRETREIAFEMCELAALSGLTPDYGGTLKNIANGVRQVAYLPGSATP